jgi:hypothetical protein
VSHETRWPFRVSPFFSSTSIGLPWAALRSESGSYSERPQIRFRRSVELGGVGRTIVSRFDDGEDVGGQKYMMLLYRWPVGVEAWLGLSAVI